MIPNQHTLDFIKEHKNDNIQELGFKKHSPDIDLKTALQQISAHRIAEKKIPSWAKCESLLYPRHLSLEQCSSEPTAKYKQELLIRIFGERRYSLTDLTGGMGVDCYFMSENAEKTVYVERDGELCDLAKHNFNILGKNIDVVNTCAEDYIGTMGFQENNVIYIDPARRDSAGRKTVSLHDCTPDISIIQKDLLNKAPNVIIKLSPMLDITLACKELEQHIEEVHIVSVQNECKELLLRMTANRTENPSIYCVNIESDGNYQLFNATLNEEKETIATYANALSGYLYEPNSSIMKAGLFKSVSTKFHIDKLHRDSHLYSSDNLTENFPGRTFKIDKVIPFSKKGISEVKSATERANIATRNFPISANDLRKRLKLADGGEIYMFGTTLHTREKVLILTSKIK